MNTSITRHQTNHHEGESVLFKTGEDIFEEAEILAVRLDQLLIPYYIIRICRSGMEKQVYDCHITSLTHEFWDWGSLNNLHPFQEKTYNNDDHARRLATTNFVSNNQPVYFTNPVDKHYSIIDNNNTVDDLNSDSYNDTTSRSITQLRNSKEFPLKSILRPTSYGSYAVRNHIQRKSIQSSSSYSETDSVHMMDAGSTDEWVCDESITSKREMSYSRSGDEGLDAIRRFRCKLSLQQLTTDIGGAISNEQVNIKRVHDSIGNPFEPKYGSFEQPLAKRMRLTSERKSYPSDSLISKEIHNIPECSNDFEALRRDAIFSWRKNDKTNNFHAKRLLRGRPKESPYIKLMLRDLAIRILREDQVFVSRSVQSDNNDQIDDQFDNLNRMSEIRSCDRENSLYLETLEKARASRLRKPAAPAKRRKSPILKSKHRQSDDGKEEVDAASPATQDQHHFEIQWDPNSKPIETSQVSSEEEKVTLQLPRGEETSFDATHVGPFSKTPTIRTNIKDEPSTRKDSYHNFISSTTASNTASQTSKGDKFLARSDPSQESNKGPHKPYISMVTFAPEPIARGAHHGALQSNEHNRHVLEGVEEEMNSRSKSGVPFNFMPRAHELENNSSRESKSRVLEMVGYITGFIMKVWEFSLPRRTDESFEIHEASNAHSTTNLKNPSLYIDSIYPKIDFQRRMKQSEHPNRKSQCGERGKPLYVKNPKDMIPAAPRGWESAFSLMPGQWRCRTCNFKNSDYAISCASCTSVNDSKNDCASETFTV